MCIQVPISPEEEEIISKMIRNITMGAFLKASPFASGQRSRLDLGMSSDFFFDHLYWHSSEAESYLNDIQRRIEQELRKNIILYGYQGCGKTTFVHYMLRRLNCRNIFINFDAYVDNGNEIKHELVAHLYRSIMRDMTGRDGQDGMYPLYGRKCAVSQKFCEVFNSHENRRIISEKYDSWNCYAWFFDKLKHTMVLYSSTADQVGLSWDAFEKKKDTYPETDLKTHIAQLDINQLMVAIVLWDIAYMLTFEKEDQCCIVFESLDTIFNAAALPDFTKQIIYFRNNIDSILAELQYNGTSLAKMNQLYTLIFVMRETTKCEFVDHFVGRVEMYIPHRSMSFLYEMKDVVRHRNSYLHDLKLHLLNSGEDITDLEKLEEKLTQIENIMEDPYIKDRIFGLFNRNFRVCTEIFSEISFMVPDTYVAAMRVKSMQGMDWSISRYASRCILFRQIFNQFSMEGYFDILKSSEYHLEVNRRHYSVNLSRYILLYLNNRQGISRTEEDKENHMVSLKELFEDLLNICSDQKLIVSSLWNMYEMRKTQFWGHLITFDDMLTLNPDVLETQLSWVIKDDLDHKFGKVRITTAGLAYLDLLLPHFEYYAARHFKSYSKSLFAYSLKEFFETQPNQPEQPLTMVLFEVLDEVKDCFYRLSQFYKTALKGIEQYAPKNFLDSNFAWRKINGKTGTVVKMFHGERMIHSHIGYLNTLRTYCFRLVDNAAFQGVFNMDLDLIEPLKKVMGINGTQKSIPTIARMWDKNITHFWVHSIGDQSTTFRRKWVDTRAMYKGESDIRQYVPVQEISVFLKLFFNITIIDVIKQYIQMIKSAHKDDYIAVSNDSFYLASCYMACIRERIAKKGYTDFLTSIDKQTGDEILSFQLGNKTDCFTTDDWCQWLEEEVE